MTKEQLIALAARDKEKNEKEYQELTRQYHAFIRQQIASTIRRAPEVVKQVMRGFDVKIKDRKWTPEERERIRNLHLAFTLAGLMGRPELDQWVDCSTIEHGVISCDTITNAERCGKAGIVCCAQPSHVPWCLCMDHAEEFVTRK